jgi:hypothetical protein
MPDEQAGTPTPQSRPWLEVHGSLLLALTGGALILAAVVLAGIGRETSAAAFVVVGGGLLFFGAFGHRVSGETSLGPTGFKTFVQEAASRAAEDAKLPAEKKQIAIDRAGRQADVLASATMASLPTSFPWSNPVVGATAPYYASTAILNAGTADWLARNAVKSVDAADFNTDFDFSPLYTKSEKAKDSKEGGAGDAKPGA